MATDPKGHSNPPRPPGASLLAQRDATPAVAQWATEIVNNPGDYPMFSETARQFGDKQLMIRVEWHTWSHRKGKLVHGIYRGATVYEITDPDAYIAYTLNAPGSAVAGDPEIGAYVARRRVARKQFRPAPKKRPIAKHPAKHPMPITSKQKRDAAKAAAALAAGAGVAAAASPSPAPSDSGSGGSGGGGGSPQQQDDRGGQEEQEERQPARQAPSDDDSGGQEQEQEESEESETDGEFGADGDSVVYIGAPKSNAQGVYLKKGDKLTIVWQPPGQDWANVTNEKRQAMRVQLSDIQPAKAKGQAHAKKGKQHGHSPHVRGERTTQYAHDDIDFSYMPEPNEEEQADIDAELASGIAGDASTWAGEFAREGSPFASDVGCFLGDVVEPNGSKYRLKR